MPIKLFATLIFTALAMTFFSAKFLYMARNLPFNENAQIARREIPFINLQIIQQLSPEIELNFNQLFRDHSLWEESNEFTLFLRQQLIEKNISYYQAHDCSNRFQPNFIDFQSSRKFFQWEQFLCGNDSQLPENFFHTPPFLHPSGNSYVYLAIKSKRVNFTNAKWKQEILPYAHLRELSEIQKESHQKLPFPYNILANIPIRFFYQVKNAGYLSDNYLFHQAQFINLFPFHLDYPQVFYGKSISNVNKAIEQTPFEISIAKDESKCVYQENNVCWRYNLSHLIQVAGKTSIVFFILSTVCVFLIVWILLKKIKAQKQEDENKKLALQILSHEFRTPVTNLMLLHEEIMNIITQIPEEAKNAFYEMSSNIFRMQRLIEKTKSYLQVKNKEQELTMEKIELVEFIRNLIHEFSIPIELKTSQSEISFNSHPYWLEICIKNILENAIKHGSPPFTITISKNINNLAIAIEDHGQCQFTNVNEITTEYRKGNSSEGTGLGMSIVKRALEHLQGKLEFATNPTTFTLHFNQ